MTDGEFLELFKGCTLSPSEWTHEAHIRLAWLMLSSSPYPMALDRIRQGISTYNDTVLKKTLAYHETITVAFTRLIAKGREQLPTHHSFTEFKLAHPLLFDRTFAALLRHYRRETLFSSEARAGFVSPDLLPFPELNTIDG
ncbi:MAG TPA: hypothetical protein PLN21_01155 [Gemmatales bacterium]|nr:hypothetical protein [Gemmatales bacterium]